MRIFRLFLPLLFALSGSCARVQDGPSASPSESPLGVIASVRPLKYEVSLLLDPAKPEFSGSVRIAVESGKSPARTLTLNSRRLKITGASLNVGAERRPLTVSTKSEEEIVLSSAENLPAKPYSIELTFSGEALEVESSGLFRRKIGEAWAVFSQFEPQAARQAFPCFDAPEFKTPFRLEVSAPADYPVFSNTPLEKSELFGQGMRRSLFAETPPLPTYLLALAVGQFDVFEVGKTASQIPIRLVILPGKKESAAFAASFVPRAVSWLEDYFALPYPFSKMDLISVPTFPGAMENPGLIVFNERLLLRDPEQSSFPDRRISALVIAHELAHQWFGDYVTMSSWQDLWLNEGFASWLGVVTVKSIFPEWREEISEFDDTSGAMSSDRLIGSRRIREPAASRTDIASAFDEITYGKSAAILRMFESWVGPDRFRESIRKYIREHPFGSLRGEDFFAALEQAFGPALRASFISFTDQIGVPILRAEPDCGTADRPIIKLRQTRYRPLGSKTAAEGVWGIPYCLLLGTEASEAPKRLCGLLDQAGAELPVERCPSWIYGNAGAMGYYFTSFTLDALRSLSASAWRQLSDVERRATIRDIRASVDAGDTSWASAFGALPGILQEAEDDFVPATFSLSIFNYNFLSPQTVPAYRRALGELYRPFLRRLGFEPKPGESLTAETARGALIQLFGYRVEDPEVIRFTAELGKRWLHDPRSVSAALKPIALSNGLLRKDTALWNEAKKKLLAAKEQSVRTDLIAFLRSVDTSEQVRGNLSLLFEEGLPLTESFGFMEQALWHERIQVEAWGFLRKNFDRLFPRLPEWQQHRLITAVQPLCRTALAKEVQEFFSPKVEKIQGGERKLRQTVERMELCSALRDRHQADLIRYFSQAQGAAPSR